MKAWWLRAWPSLYIGLFAGIAVLGWLTPGPVLVLRLTITSLCVAAAGWFRAYRAQLAGRRKLARLIARDAADRGRPGRATRRMTEHELTASYWLN